MTATLFERRRNLGLAGGCLWLTLVGTVFAAWSLLAVRSSFATSLFIAIAVLAVTLIALGIAMIRRVLQSPLLSAGQPSGGRRLMRQFGIIVAAEGVACAAVSLACIFTHHSRFIVPLNLIVVGLHFLPLARLFDVPRYYVTGTLFCAIPIVTMMLAPSSARIGQALGWITIPSVGCALVALATAWAGLNEVRQFVAASRMDFPANSREAVNPFPLCKTRPQSTNQTR